MDLPPRRSPGEYRPKIPLKGGMKSGSRLRGRTAVVGFESGPWLLMIGDVGF